jgi:hypothetical protein
LLAMDVNDNAFIPDERGAFENFASRLAPTGGYLSITKSAANQVKCGSEPAREAGASVCQACLGVLRFIDRTASADAVSSSIGNENRKVAPRPGTSIN